MNARTTSLRWPATLLAGAAVLVIALPVLRARTAVPDVVLGLGLAAILVAGGAELALRAPWPAEPSRRRNVGLAAALAGAAGVLWCAVAVSDVAQAWSAGTRTAAVVASLVGLPLLAAGSAMVRQAEHALELGVTTYPRRGGRRRP